jgi:hemolysin activation/secretion protein/AraC-like DNA-binding protein
MLQELTLCPSGEWMPRYPGWFMMRVAEGTGYWLQPGAAARQLSAGDGLMTMGNSKGALRSSQLGPLKLQFFVIQPQYLNGLLTVAEWHQLEVAPPSPALPVSIFTADQPLAQRFTRLVEQPRRDGLSVRCGLLQLWANAIADMLPAPAVESSGISKLRERFRQLVGRIPEAELSQCSLHDLAGQLHCSERHFTRLFREEFGVPLRAHQIELRLQRARQLLTDPNAKIINVAYDSGYRHLGLFNMMFKRRFGMTPSECRQQNLRKSPPTPFRSQFPKRGSRLGILLAMLCLNFISPAGAQMNSKIINRGSLPAVTFLRSYAFPLFLFLCCWGLGAVSKLPAAESVVSQNSPVSSPATIATTTIESNAAPHFNVRTYAIAGNTSLPTNILTGIFSKHTGTNISLEEIVKAASDLQWEYRNQGYPTMSFAVAPQQITNGVVTISVFQAAYPQLLVSGERYVSSGNSTPAGSNLSAAKQALPRRAPVAFAPATNAIPPVPTSQTVAAGPEVTAQERTALLQKLNETEAGERDNRVHVVSTNPGPRFTVDKYLIMGNSVLPPEAMAAVLTNVDGAFGTNVSFDGIRTALMELQGAYRKRGYVTVSVGLPRQKLTNATVKVQVTEGRLAAINVTGNRYYSSNNVMRALPSLHTNLLLNSRVLQSELDAANASRDRQIYPVIGPGPEPGTSELTLKVRDQLPLHARVELNNQATPNTPDLRANFNAQYDNLWGLEHQIGIQYSCAFEQFRTANNYTVTPFDDPLIANYSAYYRLPLGGGRSVQEQIDANPGSFGYNEVTHRFNLPPPVGRPELTVFASRATSDTGVQRGPSNFLLDTTATNNSGVIYHPLSISTNSAGQNVTLNEDLGLKLNLPLPQVRKLTTTLSLGADYKRYRQASYNTNENYFQIQYYDQQGNLQTENAAVPQPEPSRYTALDYFPFNAGLNGSLPDTLGTTFFNVQANFNLPKIFPNDKDANFSSVSYSTNARATYITLQMGADRIQTIYKNWTVKLHADGQWANGALVSNEQYAMGGTAGVRGYQDGQAYGDTGWRFSIEPQTPLFNIGMVGNEGHEEPCWVRASVFWDYGQIHNLEPGPSGSADSEKFCGAGLGFAVNIGTHVDGRLTIAWPLISHAGESDRMHVYFGVGAQF